MSDGARLVTDEFMRGMLAASRSYSLVVLTPGPNYRGPDAEAVIWEHGRRNFELRDAGTLAIVGRVPDESDLVGVGIFTTGIPETEALMAGDPAVAAGVLVASVHPVMSFPGDGLPNDATGRGAAKDGVAERGALPGDAASGGADGGADGGAAEDAAL